MVSLDLRSKKWLIAIFVKFHILVHIRHSINIWWSNKWLATSKLTEKCSCLVCITSVWTPTLTQAYVSTGIATAMPFPCENSGHHVAQVCGRNKTSLQITSQVSQEFVTSIMREAQADSRRHKSSHETHHFLIWVRAGPLAIFLGHCCGLFRAAPWPNRNPIQRLSFTTVLEKIKKHPDVFSLPSVDITFQKVLGESYTKLWDPNRTKYLCSLTLCSLGSTIRILISYPGN